MWEVKYSKEVRNYIYDSYPYTEAVWQALKTLRHTDEGLPLAGYRQLEPNIFLWEVENHLVVYERFVEQRQLLITILKPVTDPSAG
jgi:hypothetical protein